MMDLTIDLAEAQSDNDCDEPAPTKGQFKRARSYSSQTTTSDEGDDFQLSSSSSRISKWHKQDTGFGKTTCSENVPTI